MPYLADLRDLRGDVFEPAFCLIGCVLLVAFWVWSVMAVALNRNLLQARISCSLIDCARQSAGPTPAMARREASFTPPFRLI
jgi:hypothetical protein